MQSVLSQVVSGIDADTVMLLNSKDGVVGCGRAAGAVMMPPSVCVKTALRDPSSRYIDHAIAIFCCATVSWSQIAQRTAERDTTPCQYSWRNK